MLVVMLLCYGYNKNNTISGNHISGAGASGIAFVGETDAVRSPSFRYEDYVPYDKLDKIPGQSQSLSTAVYCGK